MATVTATATVGDRFQVVIPKEIRLDMGLKPRMKVRFERRNGEITIRPQRDTGHLEKAFKKWAGTGRASLLADGFKSVDEYMKWLRGR